MKITESAVEDAALRWPGGLWFGVRSRPDLAGGRLGAERADPSFRGVVLEGRLEQALERLNPGLPAEALEGALRKSMLVEVTTLAERNRAVHRMLVDGVPIERRHSDGLIAGAKARVIDFEVDSGSWGALQMEAAA